MTISVSDSKNGGLRPVPDPTSLTTDQLRREVGALRELIETRLDAGDKAVELLQVTANKMPALVAAAVERLQELHSEKFGSIATQFIERDKRTEQLSLADKTAIAAALQAQKEAAGAQNESNAAAITKSEAAFTKLIDQGQTLSKTSLEALVVQLNDLKSRFDKGEGRTGAVSETKKDNRQDYSLVVAVAAVAIALGVAIFKP